MDVRDGIYGIAVGDAYGVPYEFKEKSEILFSGEHKMVGYGSHMQPIGTWSDDTSLTLCLLDNLDKEIDYEKIMKSFVVWYKEGAYSVDGKCFDIGRGTKKAIDSYIKGVAPIKCGSKKIYNNGNGSLMRILPLAYYFYCNGKRIDKNIIKNISALTHGNSIAIMACELYVEIAYRLLCGEGIYEAYKETINDNKDYWNLRHINEINSLDGIETMKYESLSGSGYVISTLQSALWTVLNTASYEGCILSAVKIGGDTDTIAAIAGGIAGIIYGKTSIPSNWIDSLRNKDVIESVCHRWDERFGCHFGTNSSVESFHI